MARHPAPAQNSWAEIQRQFAEIEAILVPYEVPSREDIECHFLSVLTYEQIESPFTRLMASGEWVYSRDEERLRLLESIGLELGFTKRAPNYWPAHFAQPAPINWDLIRTCIELRTAVPEFACEWGRLNQTAGRYLELVYNSKRVADEVGQAIAGKIDDSTLIQQHWYARWIRAHNGSLTPKARKPAEDELSRICFGIHSGKLRPTPPYPPQWFGKMLEVEQGVPGESLKSTYRRMSVRAVEELLTHPLITQSVLPPLSRTGFRQT